MQNGESIFEYQTSPGPELELCDLARTSTRGLRYLQTL